MACNLESEFCFRSDSCVYCEHNTSRRMHVVTPEEQKRNRELFAQKKAFEERRHLRFINNILPRTIVPLLDDVEGCGFFIKGYFLTAGHCLDSGRIHFKYNQKDYFFKKEDAIYFDTIDKESKDTQTGDIAIFKFEDSTHYLKIGDDLNILDTILEHRFSKAHSLILPHYIHKVEQRNESVGTSIFNGPKESYELKIDEFQFFYSILEKIKGENSYVSYMFEACTKALIHPGSSGSPLINRKQQVVGLLIGCRDFNNRPNIILFNHLQFYRDMLRD